MKVGDLVMHRCPSSLGVRGDQKGIILVMPPLEDWKNGGLVQVQWFARPSENGDQSEILPWNRKYGERWANEKIWCQASKLLIVSELNRKLE